MTWWKKLIYPFVWFAVTVIVAILRFLAWVSKGGKIPLRWESKGGKIPLRWEIVGIQKEKIFIKEV